MNPGTGMASPNPRLAGILIGMSERAASTVIAKPGDPFPRLQVGCRQDGQPLPCRAQSGPVVGQGTARASGMLP
jgi:hypothetical protein